MAKLTNLTNWIRDFANFVKLVMQIVQCKNLHENSYPLERLFVRNLRILILRNDYFTNFFAYLRKM